nr:immunoglobulin light chain junction region [Macaca mulatta]MOV63459.1 immunoglobulin light chain junction region [Macaca mulatta]MOV64296.1 immunoglobulin light chain junction region [Macaca mulatta]
CQQEGSIPPSF